MQFTEEKRTKPRDVNEDVYVYSAGCTWHGPIEETARTKLGGLPCCPHCGSVLLQTTRGKWVEGTPCRM